MNKIPAVGAAGVGPVKSERCEPEGELPDLLKSVATEGNEPQNKLLSSRVVQHTFQQERSRLLEQKKQNFLGLVGGAEENDSDGFVRYPSPRPRFFDELCEVCSVIDMFPFEMQKFTFERLLRDLHQLFLRTHKPEELAKSYKAIIQGQVFRLDAEAALWQELGQHPVFEGFSQRDLWRLCVDGRQQYRGKFAFEDEPGYLSGMFAGFRLMLQQLREQQPLSVPLINSLLITSSSHVCMISDDHIVEPINTLMAGGMVIYSPTSSAQWPEGVFPTLSREGIEELKKNAVEVEHWRGGITYKETSFLRANFYRNEDVTFSIYFNNREIDSQSVFTYETTHGGAPDKIEKSMALALSDYNTQISKAHSDEEKSTAIVACIRRLIHLHPFVDGNGRVFQMLLCNRLLLENGLTPVIWDNPSMVCGFSQKEILEALKDGQAAFIKWRQRGVSGPMASNLLDNDVSYASDSGGEI